MDQVQVIADYDRTLTKSSHEVEHLAVSFSHSQGRSVDSAYRVVGGFSKLSQKYRDEIEATRRYYFAIEMDPTKTREEKFPFMVVAS